MPLFDSHRCMALLVLLGLGRGACPEATPYHYGTEFSMDLVPMNFTFFYTSVPPIRSEALRLMVKSGKPVSVSVGAATVCPNATTRPFLVTTGGNVWATGATPFRAGGLSAVAIGVYSEEAQVLYVRPVDQLRQRYGLRLAASMLALLVTMTALGIGLFCVCVIKKPPVKED